MNATRTRRSAAPHADAWAVYLLECVDGRVYTGIARDPERRHAQHVAGKGARFTRANPPRALLGWVWVDSHSAALRLEITWKRLPRGDRIAALHAVTQGGPDAAPGGETCLRATNMHAGATGCEPPARPVDAATDARGRRRAPKPR